MTKRWFLGKPIDLDFRSQLEYWIISEHTKEVSAFDLFGTIWYHTLYTSFLLNWNFWTHSNSGEMFKQCKCSRINVIWETAQLRLVINYYAFLFLSIVCNVFCFTENGWNVIWDNILFCYFDLTLTLTRKVSSGDHGRVSGLPVVWLVAHRKSPFWLVLPLSPNFLESSRDLWMLFSHWVKGWWVVGALRDGGDTQTYPL